MAINGGIPLVLACCIWLLPNGCDSSSRILVVPLDGSHWVNMEIILKELHSRGHNLTVMLSAKSWYIPVKSPFYTSIVMKSLEDDIDLTFYDDMLKRNLKYRKMGSFLSFIFQQWDLTSMFAMGHGILSKAAAEIFDDQVFMAQLRDAKYDLVLTDPGLPIGVLFAHYLNLPMVFNVRWINIGDSHFTFAPSPVSYIPLTLTGLSDRMNFQQRIVNMIYYIISVLQQHLVLDPPYRELLERHFPPGSSMLSMQHAADIWLLRADFVFEFPRPTMPNVVYVGGFQCKPSKPLSAELEEFVQGSGEHGLIVMSLGTLISSLPQEITEAIAAAFAELPQRVVWRYIGVRPSTLGNNTLLVEWFPQNDLLGHPKTKAFVAHGGTNGMYEAVYHGIPVLGLPLLFDQYDNVLRLQVRGAARVVEVATLTKDEFLDALRDILENPSYRNNMQRLSRLHRDRSMSPMDSAIFWIEYVIRHKGAPHLRTEAYKLPWYSYHSLDVAALLLVLIGTSLWVSFTVCRILCCKFSSKKKQKQN
ncbi:UDP-glucuronosyltransferase 2C1 [Chanos chanos]|uniref:UDP-glucuronosyltransferase n=1 Tax=Chanos chanos TaxID=29144 RepID=A0A6J2WM76_CHACN|nr:UDP-glucuronosyltransferase 2C1-like [Chanos chanos]